MRPQGLCEEALRHLPHGGVVLIDVTSQANIRFANNTLTTNGISSRMTLTVIALFDSPNGISAGVVSGALSSTHDVEELARKAVATAEANAPADDFAELVIGDRPSVEWSATPGSTSLQDFGDFSPHLREAFDGARSRNQNLFGFAQHDVTTTYLASSSGLRLRHEQGTGTLEMTGRDGSSSAWYGQAGKAMTFDPRVGAEELSRRLGWAQRKIDISPGRHKTVMPATTVSDLMIYLLWSADARSALEGRSVFSTVDGQTKLGQQLSSRHLNLFSDPHYLGLESSPFAIAHVSNDSQSVFDNGLSLSATRWLDRGVMQTLAGSRAIAKKFGVNARPTIDNLILSDESPTHNNINDLIASVDQGLLLTSLWYIREVDPMTLLLTGLTRDGVYVIDSGEVIGVTTNFRFNESPIDILRRIESTTPPERCLPREWSDWFTRTMAPAVVVPDFNCSTISPGI